ncbi:MAG: choice-of-anchor A family protein [Melioribacteraceae bacterium]|nr:choice-of-anchor A family protein [Melioribacteraceae bacterium]MCF8355133.1 choice-of-anchor A family protein [Melioribacteraceae bacterium]MCF8392390.1 choice-of-anchor A family protein [Melioribacteraceae bacterium]MCF8417911.1 choice-of-anchor A family protein [Melioribacteraceae bacterium]
MKKLLFILISFTMLLGTITAQECDLTGMETYTQGGWGSTPNGGNPGTIREDHWDDVFPDGMIISSVYTLTFTSSDAIEDFLPSGGRPGAMDEDRTNPWKGKHVGGNFGGQVVALTLNVEYDAAGFIGENDYALEDLIIVEDPFEGMTVREFLTLAQNALTGTETEYEFSELNEMATELNENFDDGTDDEDELTCPENDPDDGKADLNLVKVVDNAAPEDGSTITFTLTLSNEGNADATNITVKDFLPEALELENFNATEGSFDDETYVWTLDALTQGSSENLTLTVLVDNVIINNSIFDFGAAADYNVFVFEDIVQPSSDTEGRMAIGRDASLANYSVGDQLDPSDAGNVLVVNENLTFLSGRVYYGNCVVGETAYLEENLATVDGDTVVGSGVDIDFVEAQAHLETLSEQLSNYEDNMEMTFQDSKISLFGSQPILNVYNLTGEFISSATDFEINAPNGSVVLINITGDFADIAGGFNVFGTDTNNVLFNFYDVPDVSISEISFLGSALAPKSDVIYTGGQHNGQIFAKSLTGTGQFNYYPFIGNIPTDVSLVNVAEVISCDQFDLDSTPNNGENEEDDYSSIEITISASNADDDPAGTSFGTWQYIGGFGEDEIVLSSALDQDDNVLAGTWGGKISRSTDFGETWTQINGSEEAVFIWDLAVDESTIYAATEIGVRKSTDNGSTWISANLEESDVRALLIKDGNLYAGTWGGGIFISSDNGDNWSEFNDGLSTLAVHALAMNSAGTIFAGTYGEGIFRVTEGNSTWEKLNVGYRFIWSIEVAQNDYIFAGTYGSGLFRSMDDGDTWTKQFNGMTAQHIYSITIDANDNVFAGSWLNGVYASDTYGDEFENLGLNGFGVNIVFNIEDGGDKLAKTTAKYNNVYVGTTNGSIYWHSPIVDVKESKTQPDKFILSQNYPNPFNPTTTINFTLPSKEVVKLQIYDMLGREVKTLLNNEFESGEHKVTWNGTDDLGNKLASGVYLYRLTAGDFIKSHKMIYLK